MSNALDRELEGILAACFAQLSRSVADEGSPWRTPVLATTTSDGHPMARVVVLEAVDPPGRRLFANTDRRSPKFAPLHANPRASFLFRDAATQLRAEAVITLHHGNTLARRSWRRLAPHYRIHYRTGLAPGTPLPAPFQRGTLPAPRHPEEGFENYAVIEAQVMRLDWLRIDPEREWRAAFAWNDTGHLQAAWVMP